MCHSLVAGVAKLLGVDLVVHSKLSPTGTPRSRTWVYRWDIDWKGTLASIPKNFATQQWTYRL